MSELTESLDAATRQHTELLQRRREIRQRTTALKQSGRTILSRPTTLATAFLAGGLLGFMSHSNNRHGPPDSVPVGEASQGNHAKLWASLQPLFIHSVSRFIAQSLISSEPPSRADSQPSGRS